MDRQYLKTEIQKYLAQQQDVLFAYLFGSFLKGDTFRDVDVAVYMKPSPDLLRLGMIKTELLSLCGTETDLTLLNSLPNKHPDFAYQIVTKGKLLLNKNPKEHSRFKQRVLLYYFDTARLREEINQAFSKRLETDNFGRRDYE